MNSITLHHGKTRTKTVTTGDGHSHSQPEIYCVEHGWMLLFVVGGKSGFQEKHGSCNQRPKNGAGMEIGEQPKTLSKAA